MNFAFMLNGPSLMHHALEDSEADENELVPVTHTSGNSDIVHEVKEDMNLNAWLPVGFNRERKMGLKLG